MNFLKKMLFALLITYGQQAFSVRLEENEKSMSISNQNDMINALYNKTYNLFYRYLRSPTPNTNENLPKVFSSFISPLIISHQGVYNKPVKDRIRVPFYEGELLQVEYNQTTYPIGYTIHYPKNINNIDAVKVDVYGGYTKQDVYFNASMPEPLSGANAYLARHNIMIIQLNLPDFLYDVHQNKMCQDMMEMLQYCIHYFWEIINFKPESLDTELSIIKNIPKFLYGASFGGLTTLLQAQQYPCTWDGYISHAGLLSLRQHEKWDILNREYALCANLNKLEDSFLILGNAHDNNTNMRDLTNFYKKMQKSGENHLIKTWFTYSGTNLNPYKSSNSGHFEPCETEELSTYSAFILGFINGDKITNDSHLSKWINLIGLIKSYENDISASPKKLFLAEAYKKEYEMGKSLNKNELENIFYTFYLIKENASNIQDIFKDCDITYENLKKGFSRDYIAWVHFAQDYISLHKELFLFKPSQNPFLHFENFDPSLDFDFTDELLENYNMILVELAAYSNSKNRYLYLSFLRSMRSFFIENADSLLKNNIDTYKKDKILKNRFDKANEKWQKFKTKEKKYFKKFLHFYTDPE